MTRPDWDTYFLGIAEAVSARADCTRRKVGGLVVRRDKTIAATGYNGARPGGPSCLKGDCPRGRMSTTEVLPGSSYDTGAGACIALHDAQNALMRASWEELQEATFYSNHEPCDACLRQLQGCGITRIVWPAGEYKSSLGGRGPMGWTHQDREFRRVSA